MQPKDDLSLIRSLVIKVFEINGYLVETGNMLVRAAVLTEINEVIAQGDASTAAPLASNPRKKDTR